MYCGEEANVAHVCDKCQAEAEKLDQKQEKQEKFSFKKWYEANKDVVSKKRRLKYQENKEYREKKKLEVTRYYWLKKRRAKSIGMNQTTYEELGIKPNATVKITITNEHDIRYGMTFDVPAFYPSQVAEVVRRSVQTLRLWYLKGYLSEHCSVRNSKNYRMVTEDQMRIFAAYRHWLSFSVQDFSQHPFFVLVNEEMERLQPDGIEPMLDTEWRLDPTVCPFCGKAPSLQKKVDGKWVYVSCFACLSPLDVAGRETMKRFAVSGTCPFCGNMYDGEIDVASNKTMNVVCPTCGRRVTDYQKIEIERR
jgi:hypothetical protein